MSKRIILCGPTASGKTFIRDKFREKGYQIDVSYTSREPRLGEVKLVDYIFISKEFFEEAISMNKFYEYVKYGDNYYGTGAEQWNECDIFIMETDGINKIKPEDRPNCLVIFVNTPTDTRIKRMKERNWDNDKIYERLLIDQKKFTDFVNFDIEISSDKQLY